MIRPEFIAAEIQRRRSLVLARARLSPQGTQPARAASSTPTETTTFVQPESRPGFTRFREVTTDKGLLMCRFKEGKREVELSMGGDRFERAVIRLARQGNPFPVLVATKTYPAIYAEHVARGGTLRA